MRHAVYGAEAPNEIAGVDRYDFAGREESSKRVQSDTVVHIIEDRHQHDSIRDIKVCIARGKTPSFENYGCWHGNLDNIQIFSILIACGFQAAEIISQGRVVCIFSVALDNRYDRFRIYKPSEIIDVAMRIVARDAFAKPDDVGRAEILCKELFIVFALHAGIALLDFAEQAFLGR